MDAQDIIERLGLEPHPEGGWFRETWRSDTTMGDGVAGFSADRASATLIHFLLEEQQQSAWHRVDATEIWLWQGGAPLALSLASRPDDASSDKEEVLLGPDLASGHALQCIIPPHRWQAARPAANRYDGRKNEEQGGWTLVSCVVSPGFEFSGFELAG